MDWAAVGGILGALAFLYTAIRLPAVERLKSDLEAERSRSSVLYERRLDMIAELYQKLAILESAAIQYMKPIRMAGEESQEEAGRQFGEAINDFGSFFFQRRLFIPKDIAEQVEALIADFGRTATSFDIMRQSQQQGWAKPDSVDEWPTLWNKVKDDFPVIRNDIADRFRDLLDPPKSPTRWQRVAERLQFGRSPNKRLRPTVDGESS